MSLFSKSYIDWMSEVTNDGWNVLTIATHPDQLKPSVIGPVDVICEELCGVCSKEMNSTMFCRFFLFVFNDICSLIIKY